MMNYSAVYICNQVSICLECGLAELMIPKSELESLRDSGEVHPALREVRDVARTLRPISQSHP